MRAHGVWCKPGRESEMPHPGPTAAGTPRGFIDKLEATASDWKGMQMASTRTQLVRKVYLDAEGESQRSAHKDAQVLRFEFLAPEKDAEDNAVVLEVRNVDLQGFLAEHSDMAFCAMGHGLSQKLGDNLAGIAGKAAKAEPSVEPDPERGFVDFALELFDDALDNILSDVWVAEGEGSSGAGNVTILVQAIVAVLEANGREADVAEIRGKVKDKDYREKAKANPHVAAEVRKLEQARAEERLKKAQEKAAEASTEGLDEL